MILILYSNIVLVTLSPEVGSTGQGWCTAGRLQGSWSHALIGGLPAAVTFSVAIVSTPVPTPEDWRKYLPPGVGLEC